MVKKRGNRIRVALYFTLLLMLLGFLALHAFKIYPVETDFFTRFLIILIFVLMLLPFIPRIKFFDVIDVSREVRMFWKKKP